jgi:type I restriction enzyme S subunit
VSYELVELSKLMAKRSGSVNPAKFPTEEFELFSIPAFDAGIADIKRGEEIGSPKQCVEPGDVLLSKIVPHIRRAWIVSPKNEHRQIASSEWIVFRNARIHAPFLRQLLVGDVFHVMFMNTVAGVGGSLLRARPAHVAKIKIPLPPLSEQKRIAEILDRAESLRRQRRAALALLDELTQSIFLDMFGDPVSNPKGWEIKSLGNLIVDGPQNGLYKPGSDYGSGTPILRIDAFYDGVVTDVGSLKRVRLSEDEKTRYALTENDVVINRVNSIEYLGKSALIPSLSECTVFESNMMRMKFDTSVLHERFAIALLQTEYVKKQILGRAKRAVNQASINQQDVKSIQVIIPPIKTQKTFVDLCFAIADQTTASVASQKELDQLFASLQHRAFRGEL